MRLGLCTIQRDRGPWILEWIAFHYLMGFRSFYFFLHRCTDHSAVVLESLHRKIDLHVFVLPDDIPRPQLQAYQYAYTNFGDQVDWMAFVDGDEFLFPTSAKEMAPALEALDDKSFDALGAYWSCFGSSGHIEEPKGLIIENYQYRASYDFESNSHIKSIVRGGLKDRFSVSSNSHLFITPKGTVDELKRPVTWGKTEYNASYGSLRINHYATQSLSFFKTFKQRSGHADTGAQLERPDSWWVHYDRNEELDTSMQLTLPELKELLAYWNRA